MLGSLAPPERPGWCPEGAAEGRRSYWKDTRMGREAFGKGLARRKESSKARDSDPLGLFQIPPCSCPNLRLDLPVFTFACKQSDFF